MFPSMSFAEGRMYENKKGAPLHSLGHYAIEMASNYHGQRKN